MHISFIDENLGLNGMVLINVIFMLLDWYKFFSQSIIATSTGITDLTECIDIIQSLELISEMCICVSVPSKEISSGTK